MGDVWYCIVLYCPALHCSTPPPDINPFAVNNSNNNNNNTVDSRTATYSHIHHVLLFSRNSCFILTLLIFSP
jgi:hypothetical protein